MWTAHPTTGGLSWEELEAGVTGGCELDPSGGAVISGSRSGLSSRMSQGDSPCGRWAFSQRRGWAPEEPEGSCVTCDRLTLDVT